MLWDRLKDLPFRVEGLALESRSLDTAGGWTRHTSVIRLIGEDGLVGSGEDIVWGTEDQRAFQREGRSLDIAGTFTLAEFSDRLADLDLFPGRTATAHAQDFRRWGFESAALDLALRTAGTTLAERLERRRRPVTFVASLGLGAQPTLDPLRALLERIPDLRFKVDFGAAWTEAVVDELATLADHVAVVDFKAHYHGDFEGPPPRAALYRAVAERLPDTWLEDPAWEGEPWDALADHRDRVTWDAVLHSLRDLEDLPGEPRCVNIKPSRFGTVRELMSVYEYCEARGIGMYAGGQFELDIGRRHAQELAGIFHPDAPNDVAPIAFHDGPESPGLVGSPLEFAGRGVFGLG